MDLFSAIVIVWILCRCGDHERRAGQRRLRGMQRLMAQYPLGPSYGSAIATPVAGRHRTPNQRGGAAGCLAKASALD